MEMILLDPSGQRSEAVVLASGEDWMRVAARNYPDAVELRQIGNQWVADEEVPIEFESILSNGPIDLAILIAVLRRSQARSAVVTSSSAA